MKATWPVFSSSCTICHPYYNSCQQEKTYHCHLLFLADSQILPEGVAEKSTKTELQPQMYHYDFLLTPCSYQGKDTVRSALLVFLPARFRKKKAWYFLQDKMKSHVRSLDSDRVSKSVAFSSPSPQMTKYFLNFTLEMFCKSCTHCLVKIISYVQLESSCKKSTLEERIWTLPLLSHSSNKHNKYLTCV